MSALLSDVDGGTFDAADIDGVLDTLVDAQLGELVRVRLRDGSIRTAAAAELRWLTSRWTDSEISELRSSSFYG